MCCQLTRNWKWASKPNRAFSLTWPAAILIYSTKRKYLHENVVHLPEDGFGTPKWPPFLRLGTPIWPPWSQLKTIYTLLRLLLILKNLAWFEIWFKFSNSEIADSLAVRLHFTYDKFADFLCSSGCVLIGSTARRTLKKNQPQLVLIEKFSVSLRSMGLLENTATPGGISHRSFLAASDKEPTETTGDNTHRFQPLN